MNRAMVVFDSVAFAVVIGILIYLVMTKRQLLASLLAVAAIEFVRLLVGRPTGLRLKKSASR
jgi:hypothetical protein